MTAGLILAAGASTRLGQPKQLLKLGDRPLLAWVLTAMRDIVASPLVLVLGYQAERIETALDLSGVLLVRNEHYADGLSGSLKLGISALTGLSDSVIVMTGDQPFISSLHLRKLIDESRRTKCGLVATTYEEYIGVPMLLSSDIWPMVQLLEGDQGARQLLPRVGTRLRTVAAESRDAALDIDTMLAFERAKQIAQRRIDSSSGTV